MTAPDLCRHRLSQPLPPIDQTAIMVASSEAVVCGVSPVLKQEPDVFCGPGKDVSSAMSTSMSTVSAVSTYSNGPKPSPSVKSQSESTLLVKQDDDANCGATTMDAKLAGEITVKFEPDEPPKLARTSPHRAASRAVQLFSHLPDSSAEARLTFETIEDCSYANKNMGYTEHAMECDCAEEWGMPFFFFLPHTFKYIYTEYFRSHDFKKSRL